MNFKKIILNTFFVFLFFLLQSSLFHIFGLNSVVPNVLIILVATCGFMQGEKSGILVGFFCGLLMDIFFSDMIGFYSLLYMYIGFLNGLLRNVFYPDDIKLPLIMITLSDLIYSVSVYLFMFLLRARFHFGHYFLHVMLPELAYTLLFSVLLYPLLLLSVHFGNKLVARFQKEQDD